MGKVIITGDIQETDDSLSHYGVLGMKWGIRKLRDRLAARKKRRLSKKQKKKSPIDTPKKKEPKFSKEEVRAYAKNQASSKHGHVLRFWKDTGEPIRIGSEDAFNGTDQSHKFDWNKWTRKATDKELREEFKDMMINYPYEKNWKTKYPVKKNKSY